MSYHHFHQQLQSAQRNYQRTSDFNAYLSDCTDTALRIVVAALAERDPRFKRLSTGLSVASYGIKGLVDMVAENLSCPIEGRQTHEDFLREFSRHAGRFIDRDTSVVQEILEAAGLWHRPRPAH